MAWIVPMEDDAATRMMVASVLRHAPWARTRPLPGEWA